MFVLFIAKVGNTSFFPSQCAKIRIVVIKQILQVLQYFVKRGRVEEFRILHHNAAIIIIIVVTWFESSSGM